MYLQVSFLKNLQSRNQDSCYYNTDFEVIVAVIFTVSCSTGKALDIRYWKGYRVIFFSRFSRQIRGYM